MKRTTFLFIRSCFYVLVFCNILVKSISISLLEDDPFIKLYEQEKGEYNSPPVTSPYDLNDENRSLKEKGKVPQYVVDSCPLVHLYTEEKYWPSDIAKYVNNFNITDGDSVAVFNKDKLTLSDLKPSYKYDLPNGSQGEISSEFTYLTSLDDFAKDPKWLLGSPPEYGTGHIRDGPAVLLVVDKGNGWVDAFWFYFYPFNLGPFIMGYGPWGNHVGDWEHSLVRFYKGEPRYVWMSAHGGGLAYKYSALEKVKKLRHINGKLTPESIYRPLIFSARGTHANYASVGQHAHDVPFFFMPLSDFTDRGPMWDPSLNFYGYTFDGDAFTPAGPKEQEYGASWIQFHGRWGDKKLPARDPRQKWCPVQWKYIDGPTGPYFKHLDRLSLCPEFQWWNFWQACPSRRFIKKGEGLDAEKNDLVGDNCGVLLYKIRPRWLRGVFRLLMWRGVTCLLMDFFTG